MRNLERSKRVSEASNSCGLDKPCFSKRKGLSGFCLIPISSDSISENSVAALPLSVLICSIGLSAYLKNICCNVGVSLSAESDQGFQPWTRRAGASSTAFLPFGELCAILRYAYTKELLQIFFATARFCFIVHPQSRPCGKPCSEYAESSPAPSVRWLCSIP